MAYPASSIRAGSDMSAHPPAALALLLLLAACASSREPTLVVPLAPSAMNAGSPGSANLLPADGGTRIELFFTGAGPQPSQPLHVYTYLYEGRCAALPATPAYSLNDRVLVRTAPGHLASTRRGDFRLSHHVPMTVGELASGRYALALRAAPADGGDVLYCGELRGTAG
jgi:hypothetical protein